MNVFIKGKLFASKPNQKWVRKKTLCADYNADFTRIFHFDIYQNISVGGVKEETGGASPKATGRWAEYGP